MTESERSEERLPTAARRASKASQLAGGKKGAWPSRPCRDWRCLH
jgi:hypothetical protein